MPRTAPKILCAAALAAASSLAAAQSPGSVAVYGLMDVAVGRFEGASGGVKNTDQAFRNMISGGMSTSHFGLRGTEDLGNGLSASFELSSFLRLDTGASGRADAIGAPVNVAGDPFWSRAAWVGLGSTSAGRLRLGNITTLMFLNSITSNAFGDSTVFSPLNLVTFIGGPLSGGTGWTDQVMYDSPKFGGVSVSAAVTAADGTEGRNGALRLAWADGPAAASLAWQKVDKNPLTFADGTSPNDTRAWQLGGSYDFKVAKLFAHLGRIENRGTDATPLSLSYRIWELSASVPVGSGRLLAGVAQRKTRDTPPPVPATVAGGNVKRQVLTLGYDHELSKRTDLYAMWMSDDTDTRTLGAGAPTVVSARGSSVALGLRHRF